MSLFDPSAMLTWLRVSGEGQFIGETWQALEYGCSACRQGGDADAMPGRTA